MPPHEQMIDRREGGVRNQIGELFDAAGTAVENAVQCVKNNDTELARAVIDGDKAINELHQRVEESCVTVIARMQPMARDLRELISDIQIASELERVADYACSVASTVLKMEKPPAAEIAEAISELGSYCREMLSAVRLAYESQDSGQAREAAAMDDRIDAGEKEIIKQVFDWQCENPDEFMNSTYALWISHSLERVGDRAVNIAERVVYIATSQTEDLD